MYARVTNSARVAIMKASREAELLGQHTGALHILVGVLETAPAVLDADPVNVNRLRATADELLGTTPSAGAVRAIENAMTLADKCNGAECDIQHLLLGILAEPDESVTALFDRANVSLDAVRNRIVESLRPD